MMFSASAARRRFSERVRFLSAACWAWTASAPRTTAITRQMEMTPNAPRLAARVNLCRRPSALRPASTYWRCMSVGCGSFFAFT